MTGAGKRLERYLARSIVFRNEPEAINDALKFLGDIADRTDADGDLGISYKAVQNAFRKRSQKPPVIRNALIELGVLAPTKRAVAPTIFSDGAVARYQVTERFRKAYLDAAYEFVSRCGADRSLLGAAYADKGRKRLAKAQSGAAFIRAHETLSHQVQLIEWGRLEAEKANADVRTAVAIFGRVVRFDYKPITLGKGSRLYHPLVNFPSRLRSHLRVIGRHYCGEVDIRACWSTFLAAYLFSVHKRRGKNVEALRAECSRWQGMFCDPAKDPRDVIRAQVGSSIPEKEMKDCLNKWMNGSVQAAEKAKRKPTGWHLAIGRWFAAEYPEMNKVWLAAKPSTVGKGIGTMFETPIMADERIYEYADSNDLTLSYSFDGFSVYAPPTDRFESQVALDGLCELIKAISVEKFGIPIVVTSELHNKGSHSL